MKIYILAIDDSGGTEIEVYTSEKDRDMAKVRHVVGTDEILKAELLKLYEKEDSTEFENLIDDARDPMLTFGEEEYSIPATLTFIDVIMDGGVVQDVIGPIPEGVRVRIIDYDIEGVEEERLSDSPYDEKNKCILSEYKQEAKK